ncbi:MAG TPA: ABC transporter permease, partial [Bryobacteraceae bacterium]
MFLGEAVRFSIQALRANPVRSLLTGLGMVIGTASVILVVTISLTSRDYILEQVQGIGSNIIFAYYVSAGPSTAAADADYIKTGDVEAVRQQLGSDIIAATGVMSNFDRILIGGREQDVKVIGTDDSYRSVRNIVISSGRFLDASDLSLRTKVGLLTDKLAERMYGNRNAALNQVIRLFGLQFTVIGTFHEKVETFGQSEVERDTILVPITVLRYFTPVERIDPLYVQVRDAGEVERVA